jgi:hypothetical protein
MSRTVATALPVWVVVAAAAVAVAVLVPHEQWWGILPVIAAAAMLLTFVIQVSLQSKDGLVTRMLVTVTGVFVLLALASLVTLLLAGF